MSTEVEVVNQATFPDLSRNYEAIESASRSAITTISESIDNLIYENKNPSNEQINNAIDLADSLCKLLAVTHKGREIEAKRQQLLSYTYEETTPED